MHDAGGRRKRSAIAVARGRCGRQFEVRHVAGRRYFEECGRRRGCQHGWLPIVDHIDDFGLPTIMGAIADSAADNGDN
ncbi:hypothetical protein, partial [Burkholderia pseudomallei]|uniref:hypothetical protein n=1 Tax=Burkholderia pseudomallei TaxID=28450 RepID=UPI001955322F